jgi:hypothetical protein
MNCSEPARNSQTSAAQQLAAIAAAVQQLDCIGINRDLIRVLVHYLGDYAAILTQRNGCPPDGVAAVQRVLAEACAGSHRCEDDVISALEVEDSDRDVLLDTATAAEMIGIKRTTILLHCGNRKLGQKIGREWVIRLDELKRFQRDRLERKGEVA